MIGVAVALGLAAAPEATDLANRMRESAAAAQALQGPLDGTWTLSDHHRRPLFVLQITDPAGGRALAGAWRRAGVSAAASPIDDIARQGDRLEIRFAGGETAGETVRVRLRRRGEGAWAGVAACENGHGLAVTLRRSTAGVMAP